MEPSGPSPELADVLHQLPDLAFLAEIPSMEILDVNEHGASLLGYERSELIGRKLPEFSDQTHAAINPELIERGLAGETVNFDRRFRRSDGEWRNFNFAGRFIGDQSPRFLLLGREMEALANSYSRLAGLLKLADLSDDIFVVWDRDGHLTYANAAAERVHGDMVEDGRSMAEFVHPDDDGGFERLILAMLDAIAAGETRAEGRLLASRADGSPVPLEVKAIWDADTEQWFTVERDITATIEAERELRRLNQSLHRQATTDSLTGVANRHALNIALGEAVEAGDTFALMLLDMDDFKSVNDTLGHAAGDEFLRCVAQRIQGAIKLTDMVARLGGDEFVVVLPGIGTEEAAAVADRMIEAVGRMYSVAGNEIVRSCSIGIAVYEPGDDVSAVLRKADRAAYRAKHAGRSRFAVF